MTNPSPLSIRLLHGIWIAASESDRLPADVYVIESDGFSLYCRNVFLACYKTSPTAEQVRAALRRHFRTELEQYLRDVGQRLEARLMLPDGGDLRYSIDHELLFFDEDASSTHVFLIQGDSDFPFSGEIRLHSHLAKASLTLALGDGLPETQSEQLLSGFHQFVFADTVDGMVEGVASRVEMAIAAATSDTTC